MSVEKDLQRVPGLPPGAVAKVQDYPVREDASQFEHSKFEEGRGVCTGGIQEALRANIDVCESTQSAEAEPDEHSVPIRLRECKTSKSYLTKTGKTFFYLRKSLLETN